MTVCSNLIPVTNLTKSTIILPNKNKDQFTVVLVKKSFMECLKDKFTSKAFWFTAITTALFMLLSRYILHYYFNIDITTEMINLNLLGVSYASIIALFRTVISIFFDHKLGVLSMNSAPAPGAAPAPGPVLLVGVTDPSNIRARPFN